MKSKFSNIVTFLTDFGNEDGFVSVVKGVILSLSSKANIIDISHGLSPQNITGASFILKTAYSYFPKGTIHLAVVDPGVGTNRKALLIKTRNYCFIGPDNGIFSLSLENEKIEYIISLENKKYFLQSISSTFHGRDIFAPVVGHLLEGVNPKILGKKIQTIKKLKFSEPRINKDTIKGRVIHVDHFGNLITNINRKYIKFRSVKVFLRGKIINGICKNYQAAVKPCTRANTVQGRLVALIGSTNFLEIGLYNGNAAKVLKAKVGNIVEVKEKV